MNLIPLRLSIFLHKEHVNVRCAKSTRLAINTWNDVIHIKDPPTLCCPFCNAFFGSELVLNSFFLPIIWQQYPLLSCRSCCAFVTLG